MKYNPHAASSQKQILTWTSLELTPLRGQCKTTSACEVMLTLAWHHGPVKKNRSCHGANRSEANCWHLIYSQTLPEDLPEAKVFPFWLPVAQCWGLPGSLSRSLCASESGLRHTDPLSKGDSIQQSYKF